MVSIKKYKELRFFPSQNKANCNKIVQKKGFIMSGTLIINDTNSVLADQINSTLDTSTDISFLVGYFYFSGFAELYKKIGDRKMRILVGLDIDVDVYNVVREFENTYTPVKSYRSQTHIRNEYYKKYI